MGYSSFFSGSGKLFLYSLSKSCKTEFSSLSSSRLIPQGTNGVSKHSINCYLVIVLSLFTDKK